MPLPVEIAWICPVCGYIHYGSEPPESCPVCGVGREMFEEYRETAPVPGDEGKNTAAWRCGSCGFVHYGVEPPENCPVCGQPTAVFTKLEESEGVDGNTEQKVIIVGAGIAGVTAAEAIRKANPVAEIKLISKEMHLPYYRLNLTRYLAGEVEKDQMILHPADWYRDHAIDLLTGVEVTGIDVPRKYVILSNGEAAAYDRLILATGSKPIIPPFPGADRNNVTALRTIEDADLILNACGQGKKFVCIGGGILGLEIAGALAARREDVTVLEIQPWLMPRQLNENAAMFFKKNVESHGIRVFTGVRIKEITGEKYVTGILLEDGKKLPADLAIISAGVQVDTGIVKEAGIKTNHGIVVDAEMKTDTPAIYAAGDAAEINGLLYGTWGPSQGQGTIAGLNVIGRRTDFSTVPRSNTLKVMGINLFSIGEINPIPHGALVQETGQGEKYTCLVFNRNRLVGAILLGDTSGSAAIKKLIEEKTEFADTVINQSEVADILNSLLKNQVV
ncbi:MAG: FAD-dependent oxidoreductase [Leptolinea sp.]|jgi:nitrite reductase (NADH) large subunit|nr:FAD-dependent oxidoreductase [Leptolinea sp.]